MRVLVATKESQGTYPGDFSWTVEGELVRFPLAECDCSCSDRCGCKRSFAGFSSHRATTTAIVAERPDLDQESYWQLYLDDTRASGLPNVDDPEIHELLVEDFGAMRTVTATFPVGAVVGRSADSTFIRAFA
jgi:hypothetical protein